MVTRSRILKLVSSFRGWLQRWHTKLTCIVLPDAFDPSMPAAVKRKRVTEDPAPLNLEPETTLCPGGGGAEENPGPRLSLWEWDDTNGTGFRGRASLKQ